jgi:hypothetical protein
MVLGIGLSGAHTRGTSHVAGLVLRLYRLGPTVR